MAPQGGRPRQRPTGDGGQRQQRDRAAGQGRTTPPGLDVPGGAHEPIGRDRASGAGAPPRAPKQRRSGPERPELPRDEEPALPRSVIKEIQRTIGRGSRADDIALALSIGSAAIDEGRIDVALEVLAWARHEGPRLGVLREAYGVALYLDDRYAEALSELQAYRRMSGRSDQNHLIADCLRGLGRDNDQVIAAARELAEDEDAAADRQAEALIIWAATLADGDAIPAARSLLRRYLAAHPAGQEEHDLRVHGFAADLAERVGDSEALRRHLAAVAIVDAELFDAGARLAALDGDA